MKLTLSIIARWDQATQVFDARDDEALIIIDGDSERTIHILAPDAKEIARTIIEALS